MPTRGWLSVELIGAFLTVEIGSCQASPMLFTNAGAGTVGIIAGANVTGIDAANGNLSAARPTDMLIGFVNTSIDFRSTGPAFDYGVVDFSNSSLTKLQNCDARGGGGPTSCYVNIQSSLSNTTILGGTASDPSDIAAAEAEMAAVSTAWAAVSGTNLNLAAGGTINATDGVLKTVAVSPQGANSFTETGYVFTITNNGVNPSQNIVINGDGSELVILNYASAQAFTLSKNVTLTGGITSDQVLINITDGSTTTLNQIFKVQGGAAINADVIVTSGTAGWNMGTLNGRLFLDGTGITTLNSLTLNAPADVPDPAATPEPEGMVLLGGGLVTLAYIGKRKRIWG